MYQALYRKYRPKNFEEVIGQNIVVQTLTNSIINNKISHAYLLSGPRGCGKTTIAKIFANLVNCENSDGKKVCNKCVYCTQKDNENMDIIELDAASNNGVDEIREINNKVNLVPSYGKYKIYIIDEVHMLTIGAFNALLKTLEEPPAHVIFILATTDPQKVPITILSRCQRFDLKKISQDKISERLNFICEKENIRHEDNVLNEIASLGDGCLRDSISILDQIISYTNDTITLKDVYEVNGILSQKHISVLMDNVIMNDINETLNLIGKYYNDGKNIIKITEEIINFLKNSILLKNKIEIENKNLYINVVNNYSLQELLNYITIMNETLIDMKKFSDAKLLLELAFIKIFNNKQNEVENTVEKIRSIDEEEKVEKNKIEQKQNKENLKVKIEEENNKNISNQFVTEKNTKELLQFIDIRVSNTLSNFSKKTTLELKEQLVKVMDYVLDKDYGNYASMILDGELKAASNEYMIFSYDNSHSANLFNQNIKKIEELLNLIFNKKYKVISVELENWNEIKQSFNNKTKKYTYREENIDIEEIVNKESNDDIKELFGEIVEYR